MLIEIGILRDDVAQAKALLLNFILLDRFRCLLVRVRGHGGPEVTA
jgi:hypothetical protein